MASLFLYYLLHTETFKKYGSKAGTGMKVFGISFSNLSKFELNFPLDKDEQQLIGQLFQNLDSQISQADKKLSALTELKKSYLQQMFI
jgi:type I restriction enzyme S subunit